MILVYSDTFNIPQCILLQQTLPVKYFSRKLKDLYVCYYITQFPEVYKYNNYIKTFKNYKHENIVLLLEVLRVNCAL